jgi:hypothetical protein
MSNKTISINPTLFSFGGSKTKKNRDKTPKTNVIPIISPNVLRNKLLKRIKEHKIRETNDLENNKKKLTPNIDINSSISNRNQSAGNSENLASYTDEFNDSINYLQTLSKQKKVNEEKANYERQKQKRREELERRTLKNYSSMNEATPSLINLDLPEELQQPLININTERFTTNGMGDSINLNTYRNDSVPYGVLKGGQKPTYRDWNRTQRNQIVTNPNASLIIQGNDLNRQNTERENRLNHLREKLKQKSLIESIENNINSINSVNSVNGIESNNDLMFTQNLIRKPDHSINENTNNQIMTSRVNITDGTIGGGTIGDGFGFIKKKRIIKKTIKRKYTLGKSKIKRSVAVLIKDRGTRKQVISAQRDLKKKDINDVKTYLREHNLIKVGSSAPNDVIRKLYESSMLAGEITNTNAENLLYNFAKGEQT